MERSSAEILLESIKYAFKMEFDVDNPNNQTPQVIRIGVKRLKEGKELSLEGIKDIETWGGTDRPDPWFG